MNLMPENGNYPSSWATSLGLLPIPLFVSDGLERSILLNGSFGNFCLDTKQDTESDHRARAWSANVGHYVRVLGDEVEIQRWNNTISECERYRLSAVTRDLERFHNYLATTEPPSQRAVVPHVVRVFRQIRNREELATGKSSLKVLLLLMACAATHSERAGINMNDWAIPEDAKSLSMAIADPEWQTLIDALLNPIDSDLQLDLELLIRHAAGPVFQEAHREATLVDAAQMPLPGFSRKAATIAVQDLGIGVHFTPPPLARSVVQQSLAACIRNDSFTIFDPACGSAEFLREGLRQLRLSGFVGTVKLIGWDISASACEMARFLLQQEKTKEKWPIEIEIVQRDSLKHKWPTGIHLLLMNPPFVSYEQLSSDQRDTIKEVLGNLAQGRVEYSNAFIFKAAESLSKNSVIGAIIPSSFYESASALRLRERIRERLSPWLVARLGSQVLFPDAVVDAGLLIGKINGGQKNELLAFWADHRAESTAEGLRYLRKATMSPRPRSSISIIHEGFSIYHAPEVLDNEKSWSPKPYAAWSFARRLAHLPTTGELFNIHTGARSGLLKAFLIRKDAWLLLPKGEQKYFRPAVVNESIESGTLNDSVFVFYPHGEFALNSERELRLKVPAFYNSQLKIYRAALQTRESAAVSGKWWEMHRRQAWQQVRIPKLVSVQYGDIGSFGWDTKGDFVVVGGYAWLPRPPLKASGRLSLKMGLAYLALLNSSVFFELVASNSRKVRGGQWDLGNKYMMSVPLPNLVIGSDSAIVDSLFGFGSTIHSGNPVDWNELAQVARKAYGV